MPKLSKLQAYAVAALLLLCGSVSAQLPVITSISPVTAAAGASMTISGSNFNSTVSSNIVYVGGVMASVTAASGTSLTVAVPKGATNGPVTVTNTASALTAYSRQFFYPSMTVTKAELTTVDLPLNNNNFILINTRIYGMLAADLSRDGKPDLVVTDNGSASTLSNTLSIVRNTTSSAGGTITFAAPNNYTIAGYNGLSIPAVADFDGDGYLDVTAAATLAVTSTATDLQSDLHVYRNTGNGSTNAFSISGPFTMSLGTNELNAADIDGDGKPDVAGINYSSHSVSVLLNTSSGVGNISFGTETAVNLGTSQLFGRLADLDGDGKPDIISANGASSGIQILRNTSSSGSVSFAPSVTVTTGSSPGRIAIGDIDGDGRLDIVVAHAGSNTLKIFHNASSPGSFSFDQTVDLAMGSRQQSVALGDLNGDGLLDLAIGLDNYVTSVVKNTSISGTISFDLSGKLDLTDPDRFSNGMVIADFNNDGTTDLISGVTNTGRLYVYRNSLQFAPTITSVSPVNAAPGVSVVITGTNFNSTAVNNYAYFGATRATVTAGNSTSLTVTVPAGASYGPVSVLNAANRLTGIGRQSFLPAFTPGKTSLAATDFVGQTTVTSAGNTLYGLLVTDLDNDKKPDIIETDRSGDRLFLRKNNSSSGTISFAAPVTQNLSAYQEPCYPAAGDLDGNGFADIIVPSYVANSFAVLTNAGTISSLTVTGSFATGAGPLAAAVGDLDGDGRLDVVTGNNSASSVSILRNTTNGSTVSFAAKTDLGIGTDAIMAVRIADMDGDGKPDIIAQNSSTNITPGTSYLSIFRNTSTLGSISMDTRQDFTSLKAPWGMAIGDVDGDGLPDIVVANSTSGNTSFSVFRNTSSSGSVSFDTKVDINTVKGQVSVSLGDLNGDGKPDVVVSLLDPLSGSDYKVCAFPNTSTSGNISFGTRVDLAAEATPQVNTIQDLDGDGKPDILSGNYDQHTITIYRNASIAPPVTQASNISVTALGTSASLSWTNGSGSKRAVFMKEDNTGSATPVTGTDYTANTVLGSGTQIGSTGWYCVYNGTGNTVTISGLTPSHTYRAMVTEFNDGGLSGTAQYNTNTATGNPVNLTTLATLSSISVTTVSATVNTASVDYAVQFASAVAGLSTSNFSLNTSGITGASVTAVSGSGTNFTVTVSTGSGDGTLALSLANDAGLTPSLTNTLPFTGATYTIDKTVPALNPVSIASSNTNTARARTGDIVTLTFTASETINTPSVTLAGHTATVSNTGGDQWSATYTMTGADAAGPVSFSIAFSDLPGNNGITVTGTTNSSSVVFDKTAPVMNTVTIASSNADIARAKTGDAVTLNFTSQETVLQPSVQIAGHTVTATNTGGNDWTATYTMTGSDAEGAIAFSIGFNDLSGNTGTTVTATTNSSNVVFDRTVPVLNTVTIASSNADIAKAKPGDVITLSFTSQEAILQPSVQIMGHAITATNTGANNWSAVYTMSGSDAEGAVAFSIGFNDLAGNAGIAVTATTNSSSVVFDKTLPVLNIVTIVSSNAAVTKAKPGDVITVGFTANESILQPSVLIAGHAVTATHTTGNDWTAVYTMNSSDAEGTVSFSITYNDLSGNAGAAVTATTNSSSVVFDKTTPVLTAVAISSSNTDATKAKPGNVITLNFTVQETIASPSVQIAGHAVTATNSSGNNWTAAYTMASTDAEGMVAFNIGFSDVAGNTGTAVTATTNSSSVVFDKTIPVLNTVTIISSNTDVTKAKPGDVITVSFTATETLQTPSVSIAGHAANVVNTGGNGWAATYSMTAADAEGTIPFQVSFNDLSGNAGTPVTTTTNNSSVSFIRTAPVLTVVSIASNNANTATAIPGNTVTLQFTSGSTIGTPAVTIATHTVTATSAGNNHWTASYTLTAADAQGLVPFTIAFSDLAGNAGATVNGTTDNSSVTFTIPIGNASPVFTAGASQAFAVCENGDAQNIGTLLQASDPDNGQTLTWSVVSAPAHGTLGGLPATAVANGSSVTPSNVYYRPATGYHGMDVWTVRVTDGIASADINLSVTIHALPSGTITAAQTVLCGNNGTVTLTASGGDTYRWFLEGVQIPGTASQLAISQTGNYTATIVSAQGCSAPATGTVAITRLQAPLAQFSFSNYCINQPVQFTNQSTINNSGTVSYQWSDNNAHSSTATSPVFTYGQTGAFDVKLKVIPQACPAIADSVIKTITIVTAVPGIRLPTVDASKNTLTQLHARTQNGATYSWVPGNYLTSPFIADPQVFTRVQQEYKILVTAPGGCITTDTLLVRVQAASAIYVPNVFTPNGDGQNDLLLPTTVATIKALRFFRVFNRWGKMLFETTQKDKGWDGRYNGQLQPLDTYTWVIEGVDENGTIIKKQGSVTLLR